MTTLGGGTLADSCWWESWDPPGEHRNLSRKPRQSCAYLRALEAVYYWPLRAPWRVGPGFVEEFSSVHKKDILTVNLTLLFSRTDKSKSAIRNQSDGKFGYWCKHKLSTQGPGHRPHTIIGIQKYSEFAIWMRLRQPSKFKNI